MAVFIVLWPYLATTKLKSVIRHNLGHSTVLIKLCTYINNLKNLFMIIYLPNRLRNIRMIIKQSRYNFKKPHKTHSKKKFQKHKKPVHFYGSLATNYT